MTIDPYFVVKHTLVKPQVVPLPGHPAPLFLPYEIQQ